MLRPTHTHAASNVCQHRTAGPGVLSFVSCTFARQVDLRCLLASLGHADRELRTARSAIDAGTPQYRGRLRSRSLDREELQEQLIQARLRAAQLELERDQHMMSVRQLQAANRVLQAGALTYSNQPHGVRKRVGRGIEAHAIAPLTQS